MIIPRCWLGDTETIELTQAEVVARLRHATERAGSQRAWARQHSVSAAYVSDVLAGRRDPGDSILRPLGLQAITRYSRTYAPSPSPISEDADGRGVVFTKLAPAERLAAKLAPSTAQEHGD